MKIQCDVCGSAEASVFCCADEAALCDPCDCRVHRANKLAGKHRRFSLLQPTTTSSSPRSLPLCDVCQERRGFVFCQEDRAILCRDCDAPIHTATSLTMKHSRFLITGATLSSVPIPSSSSPPDAEAEVTSSKTYKKDQEKALALEAALLSTAAVTSSSAASAATTTATDDRSSISEYLMKMLPGWHVEDFLTDDSSATTAAADGFCPVDDVTPFPDAEEFPIWVPRITPVNHPVPAAAASGGEFHPGPGLARLKEASPSQHRQSRRRWSEDAYAVPQIPHECGVNKRSRPNIWYF